MTFSIVSITFVCDSIQCCAVEASICRVMAMAAIEIAAVGVICFLLPFCLLILQSLFYAKLGLELSFG